MIAISAKITSLLKCTVPKKRNYYQNEGYPPSGMSDLHQLWVILAEMAIMFSPPPTLRSLMTEGGLNMTAISAKITHVLERTKHDSHLG
jgi:hypothetical protein